MEDEYELLFNKYCEKIRGNDKTIQLIIIKSCGYKFILHISKKATLKELYKLICNELDNFKTISLYTSNNNSNKVPCDTSLLINYIKNNNLRPIYNIPNPAVYRFYLDDINT